MQSDSAYLATFPAMMRLLQESSGGDFASIPQSYLEYFNHVYSDGDVSLLPAVSTLENIEFAEYWQIEEAMDLLSKVNPNCWPDLESIESIDFEELLSEECEEEVVNYVEDNLGTSEKVEKVLKSVIESVFGKGVSGIRDRYGNFASPKNNFLQEQDGTFSGIFSAESHRFLFEIAPTESGWICTYRLMEKSLDNLEKPKFEGQRRDKNSQHRTVRSKAWR